MTPRIFLSWVWALLPVLTFGVATPLVFAFAAARRFNAFTLALAVVFTTAFSVFLSVPDEHALEDVSMILCWLVGSGFSLGMRRYVFERPAVDKGKKPPQENSGHRIGKHRPKVEKRRYADRGSEGNAALLAKAQARRELRAQARAILDDDPLIAEEMGIGRPDLESGYDDGGLVDLNSAPVELLARMSGLGEERAAALVRTREAAGPFISVEDAVIRTDLPPHLVDVLAEYAVFR